MNNLKNDAENKEKKVEKQDENGDKEEEKKAEKEEKRVEKEEKVVKVEKIEIPLVLRRQGSNTNCSYTDSTCVCGDDESLSKQDSDSKIKNQIISKEPHETHKWITIDRLNELRKRALDAIKYHKVCTIRGCFYSVRRALQQRGWVEKLDIHRRTQCTPTQCSIAYEDLVEHLPARKAGETRRQHIIKCERNVLSRLLEHIPVDLLWAARKEKADWIDMARNPGLLHNKFHKVPFTSKEGLCNVLRECYWFYQEGMTEICYPRCYNVWNLEELLEFVDDYRLTACISFLKFITAAYRNKGIGDISSPTGEIPMATIEFCIRRCHEYVEYRQHEDIDKDDIVRIWEHDWDNVLSQFHLLTREKGKIQTTPKLLLEPVLEKASAALDEVIQYWPQYNLDGHLNIWIVKPGNKCRGRGIHLMNDLKQIIQLVNPPIVSKTRYVVQKYIERPLVIHNTKFDIRQWFLVTSVQPLVVWMYKESYLRFSSQQYNLMNYHESVHLTNYAIQKKYSNGKRDDRLPTENMWDCHTFQAYLRTIGKARVWSERIYPGMQQAIVGSMLASQENMDRRLNTFELFGADFMISEDFSPWLIEINSSPDLGASTSVTARLCPQCLEDVVKVVVDRRNDAKADTGAFECVYKQVIPPAPAYMGLNLYLKGSQILPKSGIQRKEKPRDDVRVFPKKPTQTVYHMTKPQRNPECTNVPLILNVTDYLENKIKMDQLNKNTVVVYKRPTNIIQNSSQITTITQRLTPPIDNIKTTDDSINTTTAPLKNNNNHNNNNENNNQPDCRKLITSLSSTTMFRLNKKRAERNERRNELYAKRHTSCGPRLVIHVEDEATNTAENDNNAKKEIECIGNRYGVDTLSVGDWDSINQLTNNSSSSSSRNQSLENIHKTKSASNININQNSGGGRLASLTKSSTLGAKNKNRDIKYQHSNGGSNSNSKNHNRNPVMSSLSARDTTIHNGNKNNFCSHFFAVGMSLRAWRMKYNKLIKPHKEQQQHHGKSFVHACIVPSAKNHQIQSAATVNHRKNVIPTQTSLALDTNRHGGRKTLGKTPILLEKIK